MRKHHATINKSDSNRDFICEPVWLMKLPLMILFNVFRLWQWDKATTQTRERHGDKTMRQGDNDKETIERDEQGDMRLRDKGIPLNLIRNRWQMKRGNWGNSEEREWMNELMAVGCLRAPNRSSICSPWCIMLLIDLLAVVHVVHSFARSFAPRRSFICPSHASFSAPSKALTATQF